MPEQDAYYALKLPPEKAVEFLRSKGYEISFDWHSVWQEAHSKAFTVAKAMNLDVLSDIRGAVDKALEEGQTLREFQDQLEPKLRADGWWGKQMMTDPLTGELRPVLLGSPRRLETIFRTNLATSYSAARYNELMESVDTRPFWQFVAVMDSHTRPSHAILNGKVFRYDDPFWARFFPPLDWGCRCRVRALTIEQVRAKGLKVESSAGLITLDDRLISKRSGEVAQVATYKDPLTGAKVSCGLGWSYNPGAAWHLDDVAWQKARLMPDEVKYDFISDMAKANLAKQLFPSWVESILARNRYMGFSMTLGWIKPDIWKTLEAEKVQPSSPIIVANDKGVIHMNRQVKQERGAALSLEEFKNLPGLLQNPEAVLLDTKENALLFVTSAGDKKLKVMVQLDYRLKGRQSPVNFITTAGRVLASNLGDPRYKLLWGKI